MGNGGWGLGFRGQWVMATDTPEILKVTGTTISRRLACIMLWGFSLQLCIQLYGGGGCRRQPSLDPPSFLPGKLLVYASCL